MSETIDRLERARGVAWQALIPAYDHAITLAREAEHLSNRCSAEMYTYVEPPYPPLVVLLADAAPPSDRAS